MTFDLLLKNFNIGHNFFARGTNVWGAYVIALVSASAGCVDKNFNLGHNFPTITDRDLILHICIPFDKTFHLVP